MTQFSSYVPLSCKDSQVSPVHKLTRFKSYLDSRVGRFNIGQFMSWPVRDLTSTIWINLDTGARPGVSMDKPGHRGTSACVYGLSPDTGARPGVPMDKPGHRGTSGCVYGLSLDTGARPVVCA